MINAKQANQLRERHSKIINEILDGIEFDIKKRALELEKPQETYITVRDLNDVLISVLTEVLRSNEYRVEREKDDGDDFLHIFW